VRRSIEHFASRRAMDIEGLGERIIGDLVEFALIIRTVADIYALRVEDFVEMKRRADERDGTVPETVKKGKIATKWAENLVESIGRAGRRRSSACCTRSASPTSANRPRRPWRGISARSRRSWPRAKRS
jgi:DNA ligase (NAD+)